MFKSFNAQHWKVGMNLFAKNTYLTPIYLTTNKNTPLYSEVEMPSFIITYNHNLITLRQNSPFQNLNKFKTKHLIV